MADKNRVTVDVTTGIGTASFPRLFTSTAGKNERGETTYDIQLLIPKTQREDIKALLVAIQTVGKAKWGDNWKKVRQPLRDGDKEKGELTEDGSTTKGQKYPERLGCYFINARSTKPVGVVNRLREPIVNPDEVYGGMKAKMHVTFYPYNTNGNHGIGAALNGVQKISDGEAFGASRPSVESMFDMLDDDEVDGLDDADEVEETPAPAKKAAAKKAPAKKAAAKKAAAPVEEVTVEDGDEDLLDDIDGDSAEGDDDMFDDLD